MTAEISPLNTIMKTYQTTKGQSYIVSCPHKCEVVAALEGYSNYLLLTIPANSQGVFVAISNAVRVSSEHAIILPFDNASIALGAGGGASGGSRCTIEALPAYLVTQTYYGEKFSFWELDTEGKSFQIIDPALPTEDLQMILMSASSGDFLYTPIYGFRNAGDASKFLGWRVDIPAADVDIALGALEGYSEAIQQATNGTQKLFISKYFHD